MAEGIPRVLYDRQQVFHLSVAAIEFARALAHAAKIKTQRGKAQFCESFAQGRDDLVIHRAAHSGQRVRYHGNGDGFSIRQVQHAFELTGRACEGDFALRHH